MRKALFKKKFAEPVLINLPVLLILELYMAYPVAIGLWLFQVFWLFMGNSLSWMAPKWLAMGILEPRKAE